MNQIFLKNSGNSWLRTLSRVAVSPADSRAEIDRITETDTTSLSQIEFEHFAAYGFSVDYPRDCTIEMRPKSARNGGEVAFRLSRENVFFLSWGPLEKVKKFDGVDAHADYSIDRIRKNKEAKIRESKRERMEVNGHPSPFNHVWIEVAKRGVLFSMSRSSYETRSLHLHCENSSRYFILYVQGTTQASGLQGSVMTRMVQSFACH